MIAKHQNAMAPMVGVVGERMSSHLHAIVKKWATEDEPAAAPEGMMKEKAAVKALISDAHFSLPSFVHNPKFFVFSSTNVASHCFLIITTLCPVNIWYPGHFVLESA